MSNPHDFMDDPETVVQVTIITRRKNLEVFGENPIDVPASLESGGTWRVATIPMDTTRVFKVRRTNSIIRTSFCRAGTDTADELLSYEDQAKRVVDPKPMEPTLPDGFSFDDEGHIWFDGVDTEDDSYGPYNVDEDNPELAADLRYKLEERRVAFRAEHGKES